MLEVHLLGPLATACGGTRPAPSAPASGLGLGDLDFEVGLLVCAAAICGQFGRFVARRVEAVLRHRQRVAPAGSAAAVAARRRVRAQRESGMSRAAVRRTTVRVSTKGGPVLSGESGPRLVDCSAMSRSILQRRLVDVSDRLKRIRAELAVTEEQLVFLEDEAEDARLRALVAETPLADAEARDARRHADAIARHRDALASTVRSSSASRTRCSTACRPSCRRAERPEPCVTADQRPTRVVIAEDEAIIRLDLRELLEEEGYEVVGETGRGDEASSSSASCGPTSSSSTSRCPASTACPPPARSPGERLAAVLILTAFSQRELVEQARDAGALAYLVKPFQKSDLIPAIEVALGRLAELAALERDVEDLQERLEAAQDHRPRQGPADGRARVRPSRRPGASSRAGDGEPRAGRRDRRARSSTATRSPP